MLRGDWLYVCKRDADGQPGRTEYQGFVHDVLLDTVTLGFAERSGCYILSICVLV